ncbi:protein of unknown function DUF928 (plasmid) [Gloeothece citriformis PCC 7424]|uniref:DUF928 domain-containing protein n=1 Tax=Gloeothece citriformis (strain PCC 7424) TaxID=65393 RepID=B7KM44_GLOC7|nr:DUF928 domain-containing protein [Gloeothece citriformis]ACK73866.1 protein of unknown function DUF928 [Gloeothece citriformis PCC 7424]
MIKYLIPSLLIVLSGISPILAQSRITYIPPIPSDEKQPKHTHSGANRGGCQKNVSDLVVPLVPRGHIAQTVSQNPSLFFFLLNQESVEAKFTLAEIDGRSAILEKNLKLNKPGVNSIKVPENVQLELGKAYIWTITLICNRERPSENPEFQALIKRVNVPSPQELKKLNTLREKSRFYALHGIWYDALALSISASSGETDVKELLSQIGILSLISNQNF